MVSHETLEDESYLIYLPPRKHALFINASNIEASDLNPDNALIEANEDIHMSLEMHYMHIKCQQALVTTDCTSSLPGMEDVFSGRLWDGLVGSSSEHANRQASSAAAMVDSNRGCSPTKKSEEVNLEEDPIVVSFGAGLDRIRTLSQALHQSTPLSRMCMKEEYVGAGSPSDQTRTTNHTGICPVRAFLLASRTSCQRVISTGKTL